MQKCAKMCENVRKCAKMCDDYNKKISSEYCFLFLDYN
jgi:hypothetical protein